MNTKIVLTLFLVILVLVLIKKIFNSIIFFYKVNLHLNNLLKKLELKKKIKKALFVISITYITKKIIFNYYEIDVFKQWDNYISILYYIFIAMFISSLDYIQLKIIFNKWIKKALLIFSIALIARVILNNYFNIDVLYYATITIFFCLEYVSEFKELISEFTKLCKNGDLKKSFLLATKLVMDGEIKKLFTHILQMDTLEPKTAASGPPKIPTQWDGAGAESTPIPGGSSFNPRRTPAYYINIAPIGGRFPERVRDLTSEDAKTYAAVLEHCKSRCGRRTPNYPSTLFPEWANVLFRDASNHFGTSENMLRNRITDGLRRL